METSCFGLAHGCHSFSKIFRHESACLQVTQMPLIFTDFFATDATDLPADRQVAQIFTDFLSVFIRVPI